MTEQKPLKDKVFLLQQNFAKISKTIDQAVN